MYCEVMLSPYKAFQISDSVFWVGAKDVGRRLFDALIPLPRGTSYNSYLVLGRDQVALVDTVNPGFENDLIERVSSVIDPRDLNYVIMNHAEPDHAGAIPLVLKTSSNAKLVTTPTGARMAKIFYSISNDRIHVVRDGDSIDLNGKTLKFLETPMLHWPETMFTYLMEDGVLFPCDFFGSHIAQGMWDDEVDDLLIHAQRYFGEIMMPFRISALNALKKISSLNIRMIAPSHGPIYRNPGKIIESYWRWASGETREKVVILYVSMWRYTESVVKVLVDELQSWGVSTVVHDVAAADLGDIAKDLVDSRAIVVATPTVIANAHPLAVHVAYLAGLLKAPAKYAALVILYAWSSVADKQLIEILKDTKVELIGVVKINVTPSKNDIESLKNLAKELSMKIMGRKQ
ncbi:MAG: FprA family A-type flavoprotein [Desulfurococcaceae archaeon]|nr:FprA family A-type flavoprotein [Sulfolobales archaeon]MDW8170287.1 FprA family A-type flavoprotein [Desulfurococcaceae archaeon]